MTWLFMTSCDYSKIHPSYCVLLCSDLFSACEQTVTLSDRKYYQGHCYLLTITCIVSSILAGISLKQTTFKVYLQDKETNGSHTGFCYATILLLIVKTCHISYIRPIAVEVPYPYCQVVRIHKAALIPILGCRTNVCLLVKKKGKGGERVQYLHVL